MVKDLAVSVGDMGSVPDPGRSHMPQSSCADVPQLLSLCSGAQEPQPLNPRATAAEAPELTACALQQEKPLQGEAQALQRESSLNLLQLLKNLSSKKDLAQPKKIIIITFMSSRFFFLPSKAQRTIFKMKIYRSP